MARSTGDDQTSRTLTRADGGLNVRYGNFLRLVVQTLRVTFVHMTQDAEVAELPDLCNPSFRRRCRQLGRSNEPPQCQTPVSYWLTLCETLDTLSDLDLMSA